MNGDGRQGTSAGWARPSQFLRSSRGGKCSLSTAGNFSPKSHYCQGKRGKFTTEVLNFASSGESGVAPWYSLRRFRAASTSQRVGKQPPKSHFSQEKRDEFTIEAKTIGKPEHHAIFLRKFTLSGVFGARNEAPLMIGCLPFAWRGKPGTFQQKTIVSREASIAGEDRRRSCCRPRAENRRLRGTPNRPPTTTATTNPGRLSTFE